MTKKLLNQSTRNLLVYSILILLAAAPAFYLVVEWMFLQEMNETLNLQKEQFIERELPVLPLSQIGLWNRYNRNVRILPDEHLESDKMYSTTYYDSLEGENEPYRELKSPILIKGKPFTFKARINLIEKKDIITGIGWMFTTLIALLLGGILFLNKIISKRLWRPFYDTLEKIQGFEIDKDSLLQFKTTDIDEFSSLNSILERLIVRNTAIFKSQREFLDNAAHELQTPLALFQGKIDHLYQTELSSEQSGILDALNTDVSRLNRLNKNLLMLSRLDNEDNFKKQPFEPALYLARTLDFFREQAQGRGIVISTDFSRELTIPANPVLAESLINNLILNAIRHNLINGSIEISTHHNSLVFENTGVEHALNQSRLLGRFVKGDPSGKGNGLGLAIVHKICDMNSWKLSYGYDCGKHIFSVNF